MTVVLTGQDLDRTHLVRVARAGEPVELDPRAIARMTATRALVEKRLAAGDAIYGSSTAVGVLKRIGVDLEAASGYSSRLVTAIGNGALVGIGAMVGIGVGLGAERDGRL